MVEKPTKGYRHTEEMKAKMAELKTGLKASIETRRKMSIAHKGRKQTKEWIDKITKANCKGQKRPTVRGENNTNSVLTKRLVLRMLELRDKGYTYQRIADTIFVSTSAVKHVFNGRSWSHVTGFKRGRNT